MFSGSELLLTMAVAIIVLGPKRLPVVAQKLGALARICNRWLYQLQQECEQQAKQAQLQQNIARAATAEQQAHE
jgi:Tat protein translocase TatB subunit